MIEKFPETAFVNTKFGGAATVDELENVAELLASKIEELIDNSEAKDERIAKLEKAVRYLTDVVGSEFGRFKKIYSDVNEILTK